MNIPGRRPDACCAPDLELFAGIEAGGSKIRCAVGQVPNPQAGDWVVDAEMVLPTGAPNETVGSILEFLSAYSVRAVGVAAFGPVVVDLDSPNYGVVLDTPKLDWQNFSWCEELAGHAPSITVDTDVNCAARAEAHWCSRREGSLAYVTVGTGIGLGLASVSVGGIGHPEFGHIPVRRHPSDTFPGTCPFHSDCLEGLASAPALRERWQCDPEHLTDELAWEIEAYYLAQASTIVLRTMPVEHLVLAGGVMAKPGLLDQVRSGIAHFSAEYGEFGLPLAQRVHAPLLGNDSGVVGALLIASSSSETI